MLCAMRTLARLALFLVLAVAALAAGLYAVVRPPGALALPERGAVLDGVTLIRPGEGREAHRRVVVRDGAIESIEAASPDAAGPFAGAYVMPGLVDLHVHFPPAALPGQGELFAFLLLAHGVTAVRDAGDVDGTATDPVRRGVAEGRFPGPRVFACGPFVDGEPPLWKNTLRARTPEEGRAAVEAVAARGYDCVKAYNELDAGTLAAVREAAHARGLPVIGHVPRRVPLEDARLDDVQHLTGVPLARDAAAQFPERLSDYLALDDARLERVIEASLAAGIAHTPTLVTVDRLLASERLAELLELPELRLLPRFYRDVVWNPDGGTSVAGRLGGIGGFAMVRRAFEVMKGVVRRMGERGVRLHTGTDSLVAFVVPGASLHRELRLWVEAGFTPEQALRASARDSAAALGVPGLGELRPGAPAELLILRADPTRSLDALSEIAGVVRDGRLYPREQLDAQLARYRARYDSALYHGVVTPIVRRALASTRGD
jgi:cytosine/adenosine deaminase-related metal-dependent hydrolase